MTSFRAAARVVDPTGRRWEIYAYRFRLPNADDAYWDRGELPPLPDL